MVWRTMGARPERAGNRFTYSVASFATAALLFSSAVNGCTSSADAGSSDVATSREHPETPELPAPKRARATLFSPDEPDVSGEVTFQALPPHGVRVDASFDGLEPQSVHGFHLHDVTECDDLTVDAPHFDGPLVEAEHPRRHGDPIEVESHLGDFGNVVADEDGHASVISLVRGLLRVGDGSGLDIVGRAVVLKNEADDFVSEEPNNSGGSLACGTVGILDES
jgi:superoxide dismutase, Cu-Zn family